MNKIQPIKLHKTIKNKLQQHYKNELIADQYAWWILEETFDTKKIKLFIKTCITVTDEQQKKIDDWLYKLINKKIPIQYLIGHINFLNLKLHIEPPILIPRPETEELCDFLIQKLKKLKNKNITILDIGTGSGCIALSIAKNIPEATIYAIDISKKALELAQKNANLNSINNIMFLESNLFEKIPTTIKFDIIISNPPYITEQEWQNLDETVKKWEDKKALASGVDGLTILTQIIKQAPDYLLYNNELIENNIPNLLLEIGYKQADKIINLCKNKKYQNILIKKDLEQKERFIFATYY